ncbi:MAG: OmpH family outer membrane protein [Alistipes sp.]|nr:OmpH family outer membrane protein [Alistipes sp.]
MKKVLKLTLLMAMVLCTSSIFAQKFGRINVNEIITVMPETREAQTNFEAYRQDLANTIETMQVELNTKYQAFQKDEATLTESMKQLKWKEIQDLSARIEEFQQSAQQEMQQKYAELMNPVHEKAMAAIKKVAQAGGYLVVFETASLVYMDEAQLTDIAPEVKAELGIAAN